MRQRTPLIANVLLIGLLLDLLMWSGEAQAAINSSGLLDTALQQFNTAATAWGTYITARATWLFWTLAIISLVWTMGQLALQRAEIGDFFREIILFTVTTGFFFWLLTNGPAYAMAIMNSMRQIAGTASGLGPNIYPSGIVDIGFFIFQKVLTQSSIWSPVDSMVGFVMSLIILIVLALIGVNMLVLLVSGWILAYAGIFFLGFGGSRWTSDMALHYYRTVLSLGAQLGALVMLVGIGRTFVLNYYTNMQAQINLNELGVVLVASIILFSLVNKIPPLIGGLAMGGGLGALGSGISAGGIISGAMMAGTAVGTAGAAMAAGAAGLAGGGQALMEAVKKGAQHVASGSDVLASFGSGGAGGGAAGSPVGGGPSGGSPLAAAMDGVSPAGRISGGSSSGSSFAHAGRVAVDAMANLASGTWETGHAKTQDRISETFGGQVASTIRNQSEGSEMGSEPTFGGDSLSKAQADDQVFDPAVEAAAFRDRPSGFTTTKGGPA